MKMLFISTAVAASLAAGCKDSSADRPERPPDEVRQINDSQLASDVKSRLLTDHVPGAGGIIVESRAGDITLSGVAAEAADAAKTSAMNVSGVHGVTVKP